MRMVVLVLFMLCATATAEPDPHGEAMQMAAAARRLARDGHCEEALRFKSEIDLVDPEVWRAAVTDDPWLQACVAEAMAPAESHGDEHETSSQLEPVEAPEPTPATTPSASALRAPSTHETSVAATTDQPITPITPGCNTRPYLEPSVTVGGRGPTHRIALGVLMRSCEWPYQVRLGVTGSVESQRNAAGLEVEVSRRVADEWRIGGHVVIERGTHSFDDVSADLRLHYSDAVWVQLGAVAPANDLTLTALVAGFGIEGSTGAYVVASEAASATTLVALVVVMLIVHPPQY